MTVSTVKLAKILTVVCGVFSIVVYGNFGITFGRLSRIPQLPSTPARAA